MSLVLPSPSPFFPPPHHICKPPLFHHHNQKSFTYIPYISKIRRFSTHPPPSRRSLCRSRLRSPLPPCFLSGSRTLCSNNPPTTRTASVNPPGPSFSSTSGTPPPDRLSMAIDPDTQAPKQLSLSLLGCGSLDPNIHNFCLLFCQELYKLLAKCWLVGWLFFDFVLELHFLFVIFVSFVCQVSLLLILWTRFWWLPTLRPVCCIDFEKKKRIFLLGLDSFYPLALWFFGRLEIGCVRIDLKLDRWWFVWSPFFFTEELDLLLCNYPCHLLERDPEILVSKISPCVTGVTFFVSPTYQSFLSMPQSTDGIVCIVLGSLFVVLYYGFLPLFMLNEI